MSLKAYPDLKPLPCVSMANAGVVLPPVPIFPSAVSKIPLFPTERKSVNFGRKLVVPEPAIPRTCVLITPFSSAMTILIPSPARLSTLVAPTIRAVPLTSKRYPSSVVVPIPTFPFNPVKVIELFPNTAVLLPSPIALCPITI